MKVKKLMSKISLALALGVIASGVSTIPAYAANIKDKEFNFRVGYDSTTQAGETTERAKEDSSSVYIKPSNYRDLCIKTFGYRNGSWNNDTKNGYAIVTKGEWLIHNYIYERGSRSAKLNITTATPGTSGIATGVWSPDSVGSYTVANP